MFYKTGLAGCVLHKVFVQAKEGCLGLPFCYWCNSILCCSIGDCLASTGYISESSHASNAEKAVEFCGPGKLIVSRMTRNLPS